MHSHNNPVLGDSHWASFEMMQTNHFTYKTTALCCMLDMCMPNTLLFCEIKSTLDSYAE